MKQYYFAVFISFFFAFALMIIPISEPWLWLRPDFLTLTLIYWTLSMHSKVGIGLAFIIGLLFDLLSGSLLGSTGLCLSIVSFLCLNLRFRLKLYRYWQKFALVMLLIACTQLLRLWIQISISKPPASLLYWLSSLTSALLWPLISLFLDSYKRVLKLAT